jgi:sigma-B regulation protein RsbU (phosphoserine phosphatase)
VLHESLSGSGPAADPVVRHVELGSGSRIELLHPSGAEAGADFLLDWVSQLVRFDEERVQLAGENLEGERVAAELELARELQAKLLPSLRGFSDLVDVAGRCEPAYEIGGDFYQLTRLPGRRIGVMLGDVSSHGISAALIMALTMSAVAILARERETPAEVLEGIHRALLRELETTEMYMSVFYGILDPGSDTLCYANAGHPFAYRISRDVVERLDALDPPLGMIERDSYSQTETRWAAAEDLLLLFTDGLAGDVPGGRDAATRWLSELATKPEPEAVVRGLFDTSNGEARPDDRTALAIRFREASPEPA